MDGGRFMGAVIWGAGSARIHASRLRGLFTPMNGTMHEGITVFGVVANRNAWIQACVVLQQLRDHQSKVPAVVFNSSTLPAAADAAIAALGGSRLSLQPAMPLPGVFEKALSSSHGGKPAWAKLALWAQVAFKKIIYLDVDVVLLGNIDHMRHFPADTFSPEVCSYPKCEEDKVPAGINVGIMVIGPSRERYEQLLDYTRQRAADLEIVAANTSLYMSYGRRWLGSAEQSFIREFWEDRLNASITEPYPTRRGWDWTHVTYRDLGTCHRQHERWRRAERGIEPYIPSHPGVAAPPGTCVPSNVSVMSRRYNARPADCGRCPMESLRPLIVHYACTPKPWEFSRDRWLSQAWCRGNSVLCQPCLANWTKLWYDAEDRMCASFIGAGATEAARAFQPCDTVLARTTPSRRGDRASNHA